jgi:hypothetical protein
MTRQTVDRSEHPLGLGNGEPPPRQLESMILGMYHEMPGLCLHVAQAARLFGLGSATCKCILDDLVERKALRRAVQGQYLRAAGTPVQVWTPQM